MSISNPDYGSSNYGRGSLGRLILSAGPIRSEACTPVDGATPQIDVITITSPDNSETYSIDFVREGINETVSFNTDASATATEAAAAAVVAIAANVRLTGLLTAESAAGVLTITWRKGLAGSVVLALNPSTAMALVTTPGGGTQYSYGHIVEVAALTTAIPELMRTGIQKPSGSGTVFGIVADDFATAPDGVEEVTGPRVGTEITTVFPNGSGNVYAVATGETSVTAYGAVYVGSTGAEKGLVYKATGSGRVLMASATFVSVASPGVAHIRI